MSVRDNAVTVVARSAAPDARTSGTRGNAVAVAVMLGDPELEGVAGGDVEGDAPSDSVAEGLAVAVGVADADDVADVVGEGEALPEGAAVGVRVDVRTGVPVAVLVSDTGVADLVGVTVSPLEGVPTLLPLRVPVLLPNRVPVDEALPMRVALPVTLLLRDALPLPLPLGERVSDTFGVDVSLPRADAAVAVTESDWVALKAGDGDAGALALGDAEPLDDSLRVAVNDRDLVRVKLSVGVSVRALDSDAVGTLE